MRQNTTSMKNGNLKMGAGKLFGRGAPSSRQWENQHFDPDVVVLDELEQCSEEFGEAHRQLRKRTICEEGFASGPDSAVSGPCSESSMRFPTSTARLPGSGAQSGIQQRQVALFFDCSCTCPANPVRPCPLHVKIRVHQLSSRFHRIADRYPTFSE
jgi:hypothetical protein